MGKTQPYIKLDHNWQQDGKIMLFQARYGKAALVDVVNLFCALSEFYGSISLNDEMQRLRLQDIVGKKGKALDTFLQRCAECQLIEADALEKLGRIGSKRSMQDGQSRMRRREIANDASRAAADSRKASSRQP